MDKPKRSHPRPTDARIKPLRPKRLASRETKLISSKASLNIVQVPGIHLLFELLHLIGRGEGVKTVEEEYLIHF